MANILSNIDKMNDIEIAFDASVSEQLFNKLGANINGLIDLAGNFQIFAAGDTWVVPEGINQVFVYGAGGGGGGGGSGKIGIGAILAGFGGNGALPSLGILTGIAFGESYTITVGTGGGAGIGSGAVQGGTGGTGGNTIFSGIAGTRTFYGANGGQGGTSQTADRSNTVQGQGGLLYSVGGGMVGGTTVVGNPSIYASGGAQGGSGFYGGGGGGAGILAGAAGGPINVNGASAAVNSSAGGGGAGGQLVRNGGVGGSGILYLAW